MAHAARPQDAGGAVAALAAGPTPALARRANASPPVAMIVKSKERLTAYLAAGGDPNAVPYFLDAINKCAWYTFCFGRAMGGDFGQAVGPWDPVDVDERLCGTDEPGSATYAGGNRTLLHWAATFDEKDAVSLLLKHGADPLARSLKGKTPLDAARCFSASEPVLRMLSEAAGLAFDVGSMVGLAANRGATNVPLPVAYAVPEQESGMERDV